MSYKTCPDWPELMELAPDLQFKHMSVREAQLPFEVVTRKQVAGEKRSQLGFPVPALHDFGKIDVQVEILLQQVSSSQLAAGAHLHDTPTHSYLQFVWLPRVGAYPGFWSKLR